MELYYIKLYTPYSSVSFDQLKSKILEDSRTTKRKIINKIYGNYGPSSGKNEDV